MVTVTERRGARIGCTNRLSQYWQRRDRRVAACVARHLPRVGEGVRIDQLRSFPFVNPVDRPAAAIRVKP
jgi:hypothetical protein